MSKPLAILYFQRQQTDIAEDVASAIRSEGNLCNFVYANLFGGVEDCETCQAVIIQSTVANHAVIARSYRQYNPATEIHYFDENGQFCDPPAGSELEAGLFKKPGSAQPTEPELEPEQPPEVNDAGETASAEPSTEEDPAGSTDAAAEANDSAESGKGGERGKSAADKK